MSDHPDSSGSDGADEAKAATNGKPETASVADQAAEEVPVPEPIALGGLEGKGQLPIPGIGKSRRKLPVEVQVSIMAAGTKGAGQLDPEAEQLLVIRGAYQGATTRPVKDGEGRVTGWKYVQQVRPTWIESMDDYLAANGLKIVRADDPGDALDPSDLTNIEEIRRERQEALG